MESDAVRFHGTGPRVTIRVCERGQNAGGKGKEDRNSKRRFTGEAQEHTNTSFQRNKFYQKHLPLVLTSLPFIEVERNEIKSRSCVVLVDSDLVSFSVYAARELGDDG